MALPARAPEPDPVGPEQAPAPKRTAGLALRIVSGIALAAAFILTDYGPRWTFFVLVASAVGLAQIELVRAFTSRGLPASRELSVAVGLAVLLGAYHGGPEGISVALALGLVASVAWFAVGPPEPGLAPTLFGILYVPVAGAHVLLIQRSVNGPDLAIAFIGLVALYDIGAYAAGVRYGRRPLAPSVSPKKSIEGAIGGTAFIVLIALILGPTFSIGRGDVLVLALIVAVLAPLGDLAESLLKRDLDLKDMGSVLPGHGGLLDRIDAMILSAPAAYWFLRAAV
jgi:phosphatidate cytidylyltransferase